MPTKPTREQWLRHVLSSATLTDAIKVTATELFLEMRANLHVSVPRALLARRLGRSERQVSRRIQVLKESGFLDVIETGWKGRTAVYVGMFKSRGSDAQRVTVSSTLCEAPKRHPLEKPVPVVAGHRVTPWASRHITIGHLRHGVCRNVSTDADASMLEHVPSLDGHAWRSRTAARLTFSARSAWPLLRDTHARLAAHLHLRLRPVAAHHSTAARKRTTP
ncbi:hypothetical protein FE697_007255 [Mumia zhuanghuii]|uniref:Helix-turn-helix domain-containing protein n=2 Tax=Mumia TaxID=1546255 RepID=A0ABW1QKN5_9ACTN|nr:MULTISPECIES: hypothetical protein [Mumia]KAA1423401.1 hypothetical protein FE697_007255 [Mumia zhuanghuii]